MNMFGCTVAVLHVKTIPGIEHTGMQHSKPLEWLVAAAGVIGWRRGYPRLPLSTQLNMPPPRLGRLLLLLLLLLLSLVLLLLLMLWHQLLCILAAGCAWRCCCRVNLLRPHRDHTAPTTLACCFAAAAAATIGGLLALPAAARQVLQLEAELLQFLHHQAARNAEAARVLGKGATGTPSLPCLAGSRRQQATAADGSPAYLELRCRALLYQHVQLLPQLLLHPLLRLQVPLGLLHRRLCLAEGGAVGVDLCVLLLNLGAKVLQRLRAGVGWWMSLGWVAATCSHAAHKSSTPATRFVQNCCAHKSSTNHKSSTPATRFVQTCRPRLLCPPGAAGPR